MAQRWMLIAGGLAFGIDQLSKFIVVHRMRLDEIGAIDVLPPFLNFRMGWNRGVNFGLLDSNADATRWILIAVAIAICAGVAYWVRREGGGPIVYASAGMLIGGALANVFDRILYGAVADFLNMSCCGIQNPFAFNLADVAIFAGAIGLVLFTGKAKTP